MPTHKHRPGPPLAMTHSYIHMYVHALTPDHPESTELRYDRGGTTLKRYTQTQQRQAVPSSLALWPGQHISYLYLFSYLPEGVIMVPNSYIMGRMKRITPHKQSSTWHIRSLRECLLFHAHTQGGLHSLPPNSCIYPQASPHQKPLFLSDPRPGPSSILPTLPYRPAQSPGTQTQASPAAQWLFRAKSLCQAIGPLGPTSAPVLAHGPGEPASAPVPSA